MNFVQFFWILNINFKKTSYITIFMKSSSNWDVPSIYLKLVKGNFWKIAHPYELFTFQYIRYDNSLFLSQSFLYLLLAFWYWCIARYIPPVITFFTIFYISTSVNRSNFTLVFFKDLCHANTRAITRRAVSSS